MPWRRPSRRAQFRLAKLHAAIPRRTAMDEAAAARRPPRLVRGAVSLFVLAVFLARLLLAGGAGWVAFAVALPVLVFVLTARSNLRFALGVGLGFTVAVLLLRWFLQRSPTGWVVLLLLPVVVLTAVLAGRVVAQMRRDRRAARGVADGGADERGGAAET